MKKAFTLIEMLIVVAIIGILMGVLMGTFSGGTESARSARCLSNMRNLAAACQSAAMERGYYPPAGSVEQLSVSVGRNRRGTSTYSEWPGWIGWNSQGVYANRPTQSRAQSSWYTSMYDSTDESRIYCLTNGVLWKYVSGNHDVYLCPSHVKAKKRLNPNWSYVMNAYFGWTARPGTDILSTGTDMCIQYGTLGRADRYLLFAEIPFAGIGVPAKESTTGTDCDCILQYKGCPNCSANESIGFNHKVGKLTCANVVFADGHTEKLTYPKKGLSETELQELTQWLCTGIDVNFDGKRYDKFNGN